LKISRNLGVHGKGGGAENLRIDRPAKTFFPLGGFSSVWWGSREKPSLFLIGELQSRELIEPQTGWVLGGWGWGVPCPSREKRGSGGKNRRKGRGLGAFVFGEKE